ncbi:putative homoserine dehydrogenase-like protein [Salinibacterium amurskyense]|uniref:Putative homoserine dehydrogenase-like protein n=1 Tax=Salinibacterium amurskyense TaxID=205941 RepID=A0A2M9D7K3_9MICO|nr:oxidoreductase [Salinibacterium amurskyense]PJJ81684.1 putative homoserine dehydrogenase-like protein [Salinibacterium amurskyense]RLQ83663.1 oxidoreductase [Salinibacterium amurskyense]GHD79648.1 homoserine dehydrogenase [Salinibacterium amurskyense]
MGYTNKLLARQREVGRPVRIGLVGAGQMGSGFIAQIARQKGVDITAVADIAIDRAVGALANAGITDVDQSADLETLAATIEAGGHVVVNDALALPKLPIDMVIECSGVPEIAAKVALASLLGGKDVALMTVEADVTVGLLLARIAAQTGNIYTVCRGDEPVECLKLVEYVEDIGLDVVLAGKGKNNPLNETATPSSLEEEAKTKGMNPRMLCSFVDGTKTMIEMAALANAADLELTKRSMHGPAATVPTLQDIFKPIEDGGILDRSGVVDYATGPVAPGVFVVAKATDPVVHEELSYLKLGEGPYFAFYRPYHLASVEAVLSIGEVMIDRQPSLAPIAWNADVSAMAKRDLKVGEKIDGIGGEHVYGDAVPAAEAKAGRELPIGLASAGTLIRDVAKGTAVTYDDVQLDETKTIVILRKLQDALLADGQLQVPALASLLSA